MKSRVLSGMQPSGRLHLGNLSGALSNWTKLQETYEGYFFVADWHALSTNYSETTQIKTLTREMVIDWLSAGLDPNKATIFIQSDLPDHAVLHVLLSMITPIPWLERIPTYKEQQEQLEDRDLSTYGFLGYPILQTADVLIYNADFVPVGIDQAPHVELTRAIARRFNSLYKPVFKEPQTLLTEAPKLPGTDGRKMSKSYNNAIYLSDSEKTLREKLRTMVTDPARKRRTDPGDPNICPVFDLHKVYSSTPVIEQVNCECRTAKIGCIDCKQFLAETLVTQLNPVWEKGCAIRKSPAMVDDVVQEGAKRARMTANTTMQKVCKAIGI
ncbi:MAG: tryptophan--tRNA ligase [Nitrospiraceae bacterium]|nr:tryptophan--tRNA ligase [Nitrospiraceae bacterium]|tara:strand:+ start:2532 stop:3512 length:981 start_codon:yes stop_codon:yes gene_type:complete